MQYTLYSPSFSRKESRVLYSIFLFYRYLRSTVSNLNSI
nr:MAG TPA: hypothetical protein [Caudoviricetes sp.]